VLDGRRKDDIQLGTVVKIVEKYDQKTGQLTEGLVKQILTSANHPHGIKVLLESGAVGRVKEVVRTKSSPK
jgi:uncharacterized repeat protein (TIGR03833 family)